MTSPLIELPEQDQDAETTLDAAWIGSMRVELN